MQMTIPRDGGQHYLRDESLLLELGVPFRIIGQEVCIESQAHNGLARWLDNFSSVTVCAPILPEDASGASENWIAPTSLTASGRLGIAALPWGYDLRAHLTHVHSVRTRFRQLIPQHRYLCFSNLGWLGAWGRIGSETAFELGRPYAVWLDWVLHEMPVRRESNILKRGWRSIQHAMLRRTSLRDIRRASLGLFHGKTVFDGYSGLSKVSEIVHDVHLKDSDIVSRAQLDERLDRNTGPIKILYVGRVHEMKGPWHWLDAMEKVLASWNGPREVCARWVGGGPLLEALRQEVKARNLDAHIHFSGPEMHRASLLEIFRDADVFAFCHVTPESPRCLIEALMSGVPILGFASAYASDLLADQAGGQFVPIGDSAGLANLLLRCFQVPGKVREMSLAAYSAGQRYSDVEVFKHRSELIKKYL